MSRTTTSKSAISKKTRSAITGLILALAILSPKVSLAGKPLKSLDLDLLFSPDDSVRINFNGAPLTGLTWLADGRHFIQPSRGNDQPALKVDARTGKSWHLYEKSKVVEAIEALPGSPNDQENPVSEVESTLSTHNDALLLNYANDIFYYDPKTDRALRLTTDADPELEEELSPDGRWASFSRNHNLHIVSIANQSERALTRDGGPDLFFGRLDWVYQEEVYGRDNFKGYWWSPNSDRIAYLKLDESPVQEFTVIDHLPTRLSKEITNYPKAGDPNPLVELGVVQVSNGETVWLDTSKYESIEHLIVRVGWTPQGEYVVFQVQDREQTWLDLNLANPATGEMKTLFRETSPAFIQVVDHPSWLEDGSFLWLSSRSGYQHIYHFDREGTLIRALTSGEWEVRELYGFDNAKQVFFSATELTPTETHLYRLPLEGGEFQRISTARGTHSASFAPAFDTYLDTWSDIHTPPRVTLHEPDGSLIRAIDTNEVPELAEFQLGEIEFMQVPASDGFMMEALWVRPHDFDPSIKYPVLQYNYGGPQAPVVTNEWGGSRQMWHHYLVEQGYVIWMCDNRSASGKGVKPTWSAYQRLGVVELQDIEDGITWLQKNEWVDPDRIGIWGWSYGGFMASYALTHSKIFAIGIAGAPVTDWSLYDTIYTERYMRMPQNNPDGYLDTSVIEAAANLHGELLLIHGTMDDNVHFQNSIKLVHALQTAGKQFDLMIYPTSRHGVLDRGQSFHLYMLMSRFVLERL